MCIITVFDKNVERGRRAIQNDSIINSIKTECKIGNFLYRKIYNCAIEFYNSHPINIQFEKSLLKINIIVQCFVIRKRAVYVNTVIIVSETNLHLYTKLIWP